MTLQSASASLRDSTIASGPEDPPAGTIPCVMPQGLFEPPVVVRLAGLPARALRPLASPQLSALMNVRQALVDDLGEARRSMVEAIADALPQFDTRCRRFLLTVKRSCFNGREIAGFRGRVEWSDLLRVDPRLAERIVVLEGRLCASDGTLAALYESELVRERLHVLDLFRDRRFLRGVAIGRPGLVQQVRARTPGLAAAGSLRRPEKWELSMLRFVTRAAAKLSPKSTLTAYALGSVQTLPSPRHEASAESGPSFRFSDTPWQELSLVRINRPELEQLQALLMLHPTVRERSLVAWNDSLQALAPGHYQFVRDGHWKLDSGAGKLHFERPARIKVSLSPSLLGAAREFLRQGAVDYDVLRRLLDRTDDAGGLEKGVEPQSGDDLDQLIDLGILILLPPWPTYEARLEHRIGQFLRALADEPILAEAADVLDEMLALEEGFAEAPRPEKSVAVMEGTFSRLLATVSSLAGHEGPVTLRAHFFEDVIFEPATTPGDDQGVFQIARSTVEEILQSAGLILRFACLFNHRHDILHTLAAWWKQHQPKRREAPFVEIARAFHPLWKQFLEFYKTANNDTLNTFDPLRTPALATLREMRTTLLAGSEALLVGSPATDLLPPLPLTQLVEALPERYAPFFGPSAFVQPAEAEGSSWVLNHLHEGTGRFLTRISSILSGPRQQRFLDHLTARSRVDLEDEVAELLEVKYPWGHLIRAHPPQTALVLDSRGVHLGLPRERRLGLGDLTIQADPESETFKLLDPAGRRLLPVNLSTMTDSGHPNILRFLLAFGPAEPRGVFPFSRTERTEASISTRRLTCGKLVVRRRRWKIVIGDLRNDLAALTDVRAYSAVHTWRCRVGLPAEAFYHEQTLHGAIKPQYVDFGSPSLCRLFVSSLRKMDAPHLILEEALPSPATLAALPCNGQQNYRNFELLIDSLALGRPGGNPAAGAPNRGSESRALGKERWYG